MLKKCVLRRRLKVAVHVIDWRDSGREFQIVGPETQNALSRNLVLVLGTMKSVVSAERCLSYAVDKQTDKQTDLKILTFQLKTCYL